MELEELKANWNILNERLQKNEILNRRIVKDMITNRILTAQQRLQWKMVIGYCVYLIALLLAVFAPVLFGTPLFIAYSVGGLLLVVALGGLPAFISFCRIDIKKPLMYSFRRLLFFQKYMRVAYPVVVVSGLVLLSGIFFNFWKLGANRMTFIYVFAFLTALIGSLVEYRMDSSKVEAMKKGLEELQEFEEEETL